jgi:hypothetical protein
MSTSRELPPLNAAWDALPDSLRCHPGIKALHRAALSCIEAAIADTARKCVEVCEALWTRAGDADECSDAIRSEFPAAFNQEQSK